MAELELKRTEGRAYREILPGNPSDLPPVLCVHGWPQSSYMWRHLLPAIAPDLAGFGEHKHGHRRGLSF